MARYLRECFLQQYKSTKYINPVIENQLFIIKRVFSDRYTLMILMYIVASTNLIHTYMSNI